MRLETLVLRSAVVALALGVLVPVASLAQTFAAGSAVQPVVSTGPLTNTTRLSPGHHRSEDKQQLFGRVRDGVYTVDGMVAKLKLNYDVNGVDHLYLFVPGVGTAVLSASKEPDTLTAEARLADNELSFTAGEHRFKLTGVALANNKGGAPEHLYVRLDRTAWQLSRQPMLGFGDAAAMPYEWPGSLASVQSTPLTAEEKEIIPPVPVSLLPSPRPVTPAGVAMAPAGGVGIAPARPATLQPVAMK